VDKQVLNRLNVIISELSVIEYNRSGFTNYYNWYDYQRQLLNFGGTKMKYQLYNNLSKLFDYLHAITGFSYSELGEIVVDFFINDTCRSYYEFTMYTYVSFLN